MTSGNSGIEESDIRIQETWLLTTAALVPSGLARSGDLHDQSRLDESNMQRSTTKIVRLCYDGQ